MRTLYVFLLAACGRLQFEERAVDAQKPIDATPDATPCISSSVDWASWPMPNDPINTTLPNLANRTANGMVVTDNITGLQWERTSNPTAMTWTEAKGYCETLQTNGACWRLPERVELASIVNYSKQFPAIDATFDTTPAMGFWTATTVSGTPARRWVVNFDLGYIQNVDATSTAFVRCVRGAQDPLPRYEVHADGTVLDTKTHLTWEQVVNGTYQFAAAQAYCDGLQLAGGNWRSPTIQELETLVDSSKTGLLIDSNAFPNTPGSLFWSGSGIQNDSTMGWTIDFTQGFSFRPVTAMLPTRCVR